MAKHLLIWDEISEATLDGGARKRILNGSRGSFSTIFIKGGTFAASHAHDFEQVVLVTCGEGTLKTEQGSVRFAAGCLFHFPPGTLHEVQFDTDAELIEANFAGSTG